MKPLLTLLVAAAVAGSAFFGIGYGLVKFSKESDVAEPEREPFHGSFVCEYYEAKTSKIDDVVGYDVFDVGNNFGWNLTLADGAHMMYLQSADKFCYTIATMAPPTK